MRIDVLTIFPEMLEAITNYGITRRAIAQSRLSVRCWNPRDFTKGAHRAIDDRPYGGGPGMVMMAEPLAAAIKAIRHETGSGPPLIYLSPQGRRLDQDLVVELSTKRGLILLAGRYEGVDERLLDRYVEHEYSIGDYVISGGELAAMVVIDAVSRHLPGVLGNEESALQESFIGGLFDCPHYTRPEEFEGMQVPPVLLSGNHENIRRWREKQSLGRTWLRQPELLKSAKLSDEHSSLLEEFKIEHEQE